MPKNAFIGWQQYENPPRCEIHRHNRYQPLLYCNLQRIQNVAANAIIRILVHAMYHILYGRFDMVPNYDIAYVFE